MLITGWGIGLLEISLFMLISFTLKKFFVSMNQLNNICYYWLCMTILTGLWESTYLSTYSSVVNSANQLVNNTEHVWSNKYDLSYILPWKLSHIFYAEYGAWADREYMSIKDDWSHYIEGTHMIFCAIFSFFGLLSGLERRTTKSLIVVGMAMAFQLMNSILYMVEYGIQCGDITSPNYYNNTEFPLGTMMIYRPFMYVNVFWLIMPTYIMFYEIFNTTLNKYQRINSNSLELQLFENEPPSYDKLENDQSETEEKINN
jgi:hypothetical protein